MENKSEQARFSTSSAVQVVTILLLVVGSFLLGSLWQRVQFLEKGFNPGATAGTATTNATQQATAPKATLGMIKDTFKKSVLKFGDENKKIVFIEVGDPSCPYCHIAAGKNPELNKQVGSQFTLVADGGSYIAPIPEMKKLVDQGKAAFTYIYTNGHGNGEMGTKALYCAYEKGKFWEVHDLLMTNEGYNLLNGTVKNDKEKAGELAEFIKPVFDPSAMKQCLESGKYDNRITEDPKLAQNIGVTGTPGFYVNDTLFGGAYSFKDMEEAVTTAQK